MKQIVAVCIALLMVTGCLNMFDPPPHEVECHPVPGDFGVPDTLAIVSIEVCV